jgi:cbb3-type cytochrome oxidase subunit 3
MNPVTTQPAAPREKSVWPMFVGAFVLFVLFAAFVLWMLRSGDVASFDEEAIRAKERYEILAKVQEENNNLTSGYGWADQAKGTVRIPLAQAMELAVAKLSAQGEPRPAYPIDPNAPLGSALKPGGLAAPQPTPPPFGAPPEPAPAPAAEPAPAPEEAPAP